MATTLKISGKTVFIDQADLDTIKEFSDNSICLFKGSAHDAFYPAIQTTKKGKRSTLLLGRIIMGLTSTHKKVVVYKDNNPLNLRRDNLIVTTQNVAQSRKTKTTKRECSSIYKGVAFVPRLGKYRAMIKPSKTTGNVHLGVFLKEKDAAMAYDTAAEKHHGKSAILNFPKKVQG
jgi:hypothetical protein